MLLGHDSSEHTSHLVTRFWRIPGDMKAPKDGLFSRPGGFGFGLGLGVRGWRWFVPERTCSDRFFPPGCSVPDFRVASRLLGGGVRVGVRVPD